MSEKTNRFVLIGVGGRGKSTIAELVRYARLSCDAVLRTDQGLQRRVDRNVVFDVWWSEHSDVVAQKATSKQAYFLELKSLARNAARSGCSDQLAWKAAELCALDHVTARFGCDIAHALADIETDEPTRCVLAILPDLEPECARYLPKIKARAFDPRSVIIITTVLKRVERAADATDWTFDDAIGRIKSWPGSSDIPLLQWLALLASRLVIDRTCRQVRSKNSARRHDVLLDVLDWIFRDQSDDYTARCLLRSLWRFVPAGTAHAAATLLVQDPERRVVRLLLAAAIDALVAAKETRRQLPQFNFDGEVVRYCAPSRDPWPVFGDELARRATTDSEVKEVLRAYNRTFQGETEASSLPSHPSSLK